jgi:hypothetical protein
MSAHRAALEALFAPKPPPPPPSVPAKRDSAKMIVAPARPLPCQDAREDERRTLLAALYAAAGRTAVSRAVDAMRRAGFEIPSEQEAQLQMLEHADEERVREALLALSRLLDRESPVRRTVLESRLRRIEECADEATTRDLAAVVRKKLTPSFATSGAADNARDAQPLRGA